MSNIVTAGDIFEFIGATDDVIADRTTAIESLITREQDALEEVIGRKVSTESFSDVLFSHGLNCEIYGNKLYLKGIYRDIYSISAISEVGVSLSAVTDYNQSANDYYLDSRLGILIRNEQDWSLEQFAVKASGNLGVGGANPKEDLKQALIEMVSAKSGLWKMNIRTEGGRIETIRTTISDDAKKAINKYKLRDI